MKRDFPNLIDLVWKSLWSIRFEVIAIALIGSVVVWFVNLISSPFTKEDAIYLLLIVVALRVALIEEEIREKNTASGGSDANQE